MEEWEGSGSDVEAVQAGCLPTMVVGVPARCGMEGAEGIDKVEVGGDLTKCGCSDVL